MRLSCALCAIAEARCYMAWSASSSVDHAPGERGRLTRASALVAFGFILSRQNDGFFLSYPPWFRRESGAPFARRTTLVRNTGKRLLAVKACWGARCGLPFGARAADATLGLECFVVCDENLGSSQRGKPRVDNLGCNFAWSSSAMFHQVRLVRTDCRLIDCSRP